MIKSHIGPKWLGALSALLAGCSDSRMEVNAGIVITDVAVVNVRAGSVTPPVSVVIDGNRIAMIAPASEMRLGPEVTRVSGTGRYLMPGLWDMHAHTFTDAATRETFLPLFVAYGVTGIRDLFADCDRRCADDDTSHSFEVSSYLHPSRRLVEAWKRDIAAGALVGPRVLGSSAIFDGPSKVWPSAYAISDTAMARAKVREARDRGVDFIKIYPGLPRSAFFAVMDEARRAGLPVVGHLPAAISFEEAAREGMRSLEHLGGTPGLVERCDRNESQRAACQALYRAFVENDTWQVPTLMVIKAFASLADTTFTDDGRLRYVVPRLRGMWDWRNSAALVAGTPQIFDTFRRSYEAKTRLVGALHEAEVPLLAGSDTPNPFVFPGSGLHDELELLVEAGLSPLEALRAATLNPARFLEREDEMGTVEPGKLADLVLLHDNPLDDIRFTTRIEAVIADGRLYRRGALDGILARAATYAASETTSGRVNE